jgi:hypothetical protein
LDGIGEEKVTLMQDNVIDFGEGWTNMSAHLRKPRTFLTIGGRKEFTVRCEGGKIIFLSHAYKGCTIPESELKKVYERFLLKRSWKTTHYKESRHASYFLRLLKEYFVK